MKLSEFVKRTTDVLLWRMPVSPTKESTKEEILDVILGGEANHRIEDYQWARKHIQKIMLENKHLLGIYPKGRTPDQDQEIEAAALTAFIAALRKDVAALIKKEEEEVDKRIFKIAPEQRSEITEMTEEIIKELERQKEKPQTPPQPEKESASPAETTVKPPPVKTIPKRPATASELERQGAEALMKRLRAANKIQ